MKKVVCICLWVVLLGATQSVSALELGVGPEVGWSVRQFAIVPTGANQVDIVGHYVTLGVAGELEVAPRWLSTRLKVGVDIMEHTDLNGSPQPGTYSQHSVSLDGILLGRIPFAETVSGTIGSGVSFIHYLPNEIRGSNPENAVGIGEQQVLQIPVVLGAQIRLPEVTLLPEFGIGYAVIYDTTTPDVGQGLDAGTVQVQNLDIWARIGLSFSVL